MRRRCAASTRWILALLAAAAALAVAGCGGDSDSDAEADADGTTPVESADIAQLTWALGAPVRGLEYTHSADSGSATVISLGCETLVRYDDLGRLQPALASEFDQPDPLTYVYTIREDVKFWDGSVMTPEDVVFSLEQAASEDAGSQIASFYANVESITASGNVVTVKMSKPDPYFRYTPAVTYILQKKYWQANLKDIGTPQKLTMCTGPFEFTSFRGDERIELEAFDDYWGGRPHVRAITLRVIVNESTRLLAMRQREIDGSFRLSQDVIDQWKELDSVEVHLAPELRTAYISFDTATEPWSDVHVRRALAHATDKEGMVNAILRGYGQVAPTMPPPEQWGDVLPQDEVADFYEEIPTYEYDLDQAREELEQSAVPDGFKATVPYPDSEQTLGKALLALSESLKEIGIELTPKEVATDAWFATIYNHPTPLGPQIISWGVDYPDPADALHFIYDSKGATANAFNTANYKSDEMDQYLAEQEQTADQTERAEAIKQALVLAAEDLPYLPLWYQDVAMAVSTDYDYEGFGTWYLYTPWALEITSG